jgi:UDP-N-acetylglucosamine--N-acetylmuramyl-(pentapeptide) pyrophosphoryl-undecaprenol N-acetylglucosamine transferase
MAAPSLKILIAAGGTGGHIYPALAIADALQRQRPDMHIAFVGTAHGLENKIIPKKGYPVHHLPVGRLNSNVSVIERLMTLLKLPLAFIKSALLISSVKPDLVLGVGGHASGPLLLIAALMRTPTAIWEPNAMPGMANRLLARFVDECWVVFDEAKRHLKNPHLHLAGMPIRKEIEDAFEKSTERPEEIHESFHVLAFGGSQGARGINTALTEIVNDIGGWPGDFKLVHQTGPADFLRIQDLYGARLAFAKIELKEYLDDMAERYKWADLVICRSGASTLAELAACGKAAILIPFPFASDDHQKKNAESMVNRGAAAMILQKDLTPEGLREAILRLQKDPARRARMSQAVRAFHQPFAADRLAGKFIERMSAHAAR